jgi:hypothetical protein
MGDYQSSASAGWPPTRAKKKVVIPSIVAAQLRAERVVQQPSGVGADLNASISLFCVRIATSGGVHDPGQDALRIELPGTTTPVAAASADPVATTASASTGRAMAAMQADDPVTSNNAMQADDPVTSRKVIQADDPVTSKTPVAAASADPVATTASASTGRAMALPIGCICGSAESEVLDVDAAVRVLMPEPRVDVKFIEYYDQRFHALADETDRQDWCLHKNSKTENEARALLKKGLTDLLRPPPEHTLGHAASPVSYLEATVLKLICHCRADCCCRRSRASCPSKTARQSKYLLHIKNIELVSLRPSTTWHTPGKLREYLTKLLNSKQAHAKQSFSEYVKCRKRRIESEIRHNATRKTT